MHILNEWLSCPAVRPVGASDQFQFDVKNREVGVTRSMIQRIPTPEAFDANIATANAGVPAPGQINFFDVVRRRWFLILMLSVIGGFLGYLYQTQRQPMYQASCRVLVERKQ